MPTGIGHRLANILNAYLKVFGQFFSGWRSFEALFKFTVSTIDLIDASNFV
jgi:hypothetical protein